MKPDRRSHRRIKPENVQADVFQSHFSDQEIEINAEILDISRTGIRIKLSNPIDTSIHNNLKITMRLPDSGAPFTVHGTLKHQYSETEIGIHYTDHVEGSIDDILFDCIELNDKTLLIKSL